MNIDAERKLMGSLLHSAEDFDAVDKLTSGGEYLCDKTMILIYKKISEMVKANKTVDTVSVAIELKSKVDPVLISELTIGMTSGVHSILYAKTIREDAMRLSVTYAAKAAVDKAVAGDDIFDVVDELKFGLEGITSGLDGDTTVDMKTAVSRAASMLEDIMSGKIVGLKTGFRDIDAIIGAILNGNLIIIGGKRKSGKTTLALQSILNIAKSGSISIGVFSREMSIEELLMRGALILARINYTDLISGSLDSEQVDRLRRALKKMESLNIYFNELIPDVDGMVTEMKRLRRQHGVSLFLVDYIQITDPPRDTLKNNRENQIATISRTLKKAAKSMGVPIIALSQLNEENKSRESKAIENDCDKFIYIDAKEDDEDVVETDHGKVMDIKIVQRFGMSRRFGDVKLFYNLRYGSFHDVDYTQHAVENNAAATPNNQEDLVF